MKHFSCLHATSDCISCVMAAGLTAQHGPAGELIDKYTAAFYVYCNNGRRNCRRYRETKICYETAIFQNIVTHSLKFPEAWVGLQD